MPQGDAGGHFAGSGGYGGNFGGFGGASMGSSPGGPEHGMLGFGGMSPGGYNSTTYANNLAGVPGTPGFGNRQAAFQAAARARQSMPHGLGVNRPTAGLGQIPTPTPLPQPPPTIQIPGRPPTTPPTYPSDAYPGMGLDLYNSNKYSMAPYGGWPSSAPDYNVNQGYNSSTQGSGPYPGGSGLPSGGVVPGGLMTNFGWAGGYGPGPSMRGGPGSGSINGGGGPGGNWGRQFGGPVGPSGTYQVGENGPETLQMNAQGGGMITPNNPADRLGGMNPELMRSMFQLMQQRQSQKQPDPGSRGSQQPQMPPQQMPQPPRQVGFPQHGIAGLSRPADQGMGFGGSGLGMQGVMGQLRNRMGGRAA